MTDTKFKTLLAVNEFKNFTKAAVALSLTQPAVSHHIAQLENELGAKLFMRKKGQLTLTKEGEVAVKYAKRMQSMEQSLISEISDAQNSIDRLRIGITHTSESNLIVEALAKCSNDNRNIIITIITDTIKNLYAMLENYEIDLAFVEGKNVSPDLNSVMLDTDYLVCVMSNNNPLASHPVITLSELKKEKLILRLPNSGTRMLFESTLESIGENISQFDVGIEIDNIATIKDLIRKDLGVSILARSACMDELRKGKLTALPIENLSMIRETNIVYHKFFPHVHLLKDIARVYHDTAANYSF